MDFERLTASSLDGPENTVYEIAPDLKLEKKMLTCLITMAINVLNDTQIFTKIVTAIVGMK
ncbi:hypothetical protein HYW73_03575 [Candidatus Nomurabacteria bacterium]|nr:hypothetical protein [Candidatus Nomurabacteria bacterium]